MVNMNQDVKMYMPGGAALSLKLLEEAEKLEIATARLSAVILEKEYVQETAIAFSDVRAIQNKITVLMKPIREKFPDAMPLTRLIGQINSNREVIVKLLMSNPERFQKILELQNGTVNPYTKAMDTLRIEMFGDDL